MVFNCAAPCLGALQRVLCTGCRWALGVLSGQGGREQGLVARAATRGWAVRVSGAKSGGSTCRLSPLPRGTQLPSSPALRLRPRPVCSDEGPKKERLAMDRWQPRRGLAAAWRVMGVTVLPCV